MGKILDSVKGIMAKAVYTGNKHASAILTGLAISGLVTTMVLTVKATRQASVKIAQEGATTTKEKVEVSWKCYIPPVSMAVATAACAIGAQSISSKRYAALSALYSISEATAAEYESKVIESIGEKANEKIKTDICQKKLDEMPLNKCYVEDSGQGNALCFDTFSGRYFMCDIDHIHKVEKTLFYELTNGGRRCEISLNDFYDEIGIDHIPIGYDIGWDSTHPIVIDYKSRLAADDRPCLVLNYNIMPTYI